MNRKKKVLALSKLFLSRENKPEFSTNVHTERTQGGTENLKIKKNCFEKKVLVTKKAVTK